MEDYDIEELLLASRIDSLFGPLRLELIWIVAFSNRELGNEHPEDTQPLCWYLEHRRSQIMDSSLPSHSFH